MLTLRLLKPKPSRIVQIGAQQCAPIHLSTDVQHTDVQHTDTLYTYHQYNDTLYTDKSRTRRGYQTVAVF